MNFGSANSTRFDQNTSNHNSLNNDSIGSDSGSRFQRILQKGRLTDEDLQRFHSSILKAHKKKHYKVLLVSAIFFILLGILLYYLAF